MEDIGVDRAMRFGKPGFPRIFFQDTYDDDEVIEKRIGLVRELGHVPVTGELRIVSNGDAEPTPDEKPSTEVVGFIYLMKHGRHYKIRKTNAMGRLEYELAVQLPEKLRRVHVIKTDDPDGIEEYWHKRFASKRGNGEWFDLGDADVQAFKRRKFM